MMTSTLTEESTRPGPVGPRLTCDDLCSPGMEAQQLSLNELSDYGSDFDTDEEAIVNELLKDAGSIVPQAEDTITGDDDQSKDGQPCHSRGYIRLSRISTGVWLQKEVVTDSLEIGSLTSLEANGMYSMTAYHESWLMNDQAYSSKRPQSIERRYRSSCGVYVRVQAPRAS